MELAGPEPATSWVRSAKAMIAVGGISRRRRQRQPSPCVIHSLLLENLQALPVIAAAELLGGRRPRTSIRLTMDTALGPGPAPPRRIEVWIGAAKPRALGLVGRLRDGWMAPLMNYVPPAEAAAGNSGLAPAPTRLQGRTSGYFATGGISPDLSLLGPVDDLLV